MAGKRTATSELNHDNWNNEETPEEAGTFKRASDDIIKTRVIKTAKRRNPISPVSSDGDKKSVFGSFTGFSKAPPPVSNAFGFLSNLTKSEPPKTNGISGKTMSASATSTTPSFNIRSSSVNESKEQGSKSDDYYARLKGLNESVSKWIKQHVDENPFVNLQPIFKDYEKYYEELEKEHKKNETSKTANTASLLKTKSISEPKENVSSSSGFASFVFKPADSIPSNTQSAEKEMPTFSFGVTSSTEAKEKSKFSPGPKQSTSNMDVKEIPKFSFGSKGSTSTTVVKEAPKFSFGSKEGTSSTDVKQTPKFSFGPKESSQTEKPSTSTTGTPKFSFGSSNENSLVSDKPESDMPKFTFGSANSTSSTFKFGTSNTPAFSLGSANTSSASAGFNFPKPSTTSGFTFSNVSKPESEGEKKEEDEDDEPPKVEFTPVVEDGHVYTTKCKLFVKKDKVFSDRGVGNLFLKPVPDSEKMQLIVRADTNLGNLLCNFILSESIPMQRMGKKDVMLVCLPTPDFKPPPVPILLRVKTPEDADKLLETLEKYKK